MSNSKLDLLIAAYAVRLLATLPPHSEAFRDGLQAGLRASITGEPVESMTQLTRGDAARDAWQLGVGLGAAAWEEIGFGKRRHALREQVGKRPIRRYADAVLRDGELANLHHDLMQARESLAA
jgi:hypothetical protein